MTLILASSNVASADVSAAHPTKPLVDSAPAGYILGSGDTITLWVLGAEELNGKSFIVDPDGFVDLPVAGRVQAAGKSVSQLKVEAVSKLKLYYRNPQVSLSITDFHSQPVSILGDVHQPGLHQLQGGKTLLEIISLVGGLQPDASNTAIVTRCARWGKIPVAQSTESADNQYFVARINLKDLSEGKNPQDNIQILPNDVIEVPKAKLIYVMGQVGKPGGYILDDSESISALKALSMAGGTNQFSSAKNAKILRAVVGSPDRERISIDLTKVLEGKSGDAVLKPDDILYVPGNAAKHASLRAVEAGIQIGTGLLIWR